MGTFAKLNYGMLGLIVLTGLVCVTSAHAAMPYESGLKTLTDSFQGPVAKSIGITGVIVCGATLIFAQDMSNFFRSMVLVCLCICVIVSASTVLKAVTGESGDVTVGAIMGEYPVEQWSGEHESLQGPQ